MLISKVRNMESSRGNKIANQFIIETDINELSGNCTETFQSYESIIAIRERFNSEEKTRKITLDSTYWDYSVTTGKYRNIFLGETKKETQKKIDAGIYTLANLN